MAAAAKRLPEEVVAGSLGVAPLPVEGASTVVPDRDEGLVDLCRQAVALQAEDVDSQQIACWSPSVPRSRGRPSRSRSVAG